LHEDAKNENTMDAIPDIPEAMDGDGL